MALLPWKQFTALLLSTALIPGIANAGKKGKESSRTEAPQTQPDAPQPDPLSPAPQTEQPTTDIPKTDAPKEEKKPDDKDDKGSKAAIGVLGATTAVGATAATIATVMYLKNNKRNRLKAEAAQTMVELPKVEPSTTAVKIQPPEDLRDPNYSSEGRELMEKHFSGTIQEKASAQPVPKEKQGRNTSKNPNHLSGQNEPPNQMLSYPDMASFMKKNPTAIDPIGNRSVYQVAMSNALDAIEKHHDTIYGENHPATQEALKTLKEMRGRDHNDTTVRKKVSEAFETLINNAKEGHTHQSHINVLREAHKHYAVEPTKKSSPIERISKFFY